MLARQSERYEKILSSLNESIAKLQDETGKTERDTDLSERVAQRDQLLRDIHANEFADLSK